MLKTEPEEIQESETENQTQENNEKSETADPVQSGEETVKNGNEYKKSFPLIPVIIGAAAAAAAVIAAVTVIKKRKKK